MPPRPRLPLTQSFAAAARGVFIAFLEQRSLQLHLIGAGLVVLFGWILKVSCTEWIGLVFCIGLTITAELLNTAIETVVDLVCPETHELARNAKDIAAGAVLIASLFAVIIGIMIFLPHLL